MATTLPGQETELAQIVRRPLKSKGSIVAASNIHKEESLRSQGSTIKALHDGKPSIFDNVIIENAAKKVLDNNKAGLSQIHDKRVHSTGPKPNFRSHGEDYLFAKKALFCLDEQNKLRLFLVSLMTHP